MQKELKWSSSRREQERKDAIRFLDTMYLPIPAGPEKPLNERILY